MQEGKNNSRSIRYLSRKAEGGDLKALYQMTKYYGEGRYVEQNEEKSHEYIERISSSLPKLNFTVDQLKLLSFRGFDELNVQFDPKLTIIVGNNGAGKSAILDALSMSLSWFGANVRKEDRTAISLKEEDISTDNNSHYGAIISKFELGKKNSFRMMLSKVKDGFREKRDSELVEIKSLAGMYRYANDSISNFNLPLVAHYTVFRSVGVSKIDLVNAQKKIQDKRWSKLSAYDHALKENHDFSGFLAWLIKFDAVAKQSEGKERPKEIESLEEEIRNAKLIISQLRESADGLDESLSSIRQLVEEKSARLQKLKKSLAGSGSERNFSSLSLVFEAINIFMPDLDRMHLDYTGEYIDLKMYKGQSPISVLHLSQGEKSLMALVGDIARRLIMLNPGRDNPLEGRGIVMIDEIDLHLHPEWQQKVVGRLQKTFPNIQLILTTHSPQVLSTVKAENIRVVHRENSNALMPFAKSYGEESQHVLQAIMGVDPQPPVPEREKLQKLTELVECGKYETAPARELLNELSDTLSGNHPQILKIKRSIRRQRELKS